MLAEPYPYSASGLDNIYLLNGVTETMTDYGTMLHVENINGLHRAIGLHIVEKDEAMNGSEFRFLRKQMNLTQLEVAELLKVTDQTVANYEKGEPQGSAAAAIKFHYLLSILPEQTRVEVLQSMIPAKPTAKSKRLPDLPRRSITDHWIEDGFKAAA